MTFKKRLEELVNSLPIDDPRARVDLRLYSKWRMQAKSLLVHHLGEDHPYTKELTTIFGTESDPYFLGWPIDSSQQRPEAYCIISAHKCHAWLYNCRVSSSS